MREASQAARGLDNNPAAQAAARAVSTACSTVRTPASALGFLFYGAAAAAYCEAGLEQPSRVYDGMASAELRRAFSSLKEIAVPDEPNPAKIT